MRFALAAAVLAALAAPAVAPAADETRMYLVDPTHSNAVPDSPLVPPLKLRWQANLGVPMAPVLITGGRVAYVRQPGTGPLLTVLDAGTGAEVWSKPLPRVDGYGLATENGRLFLVSDASANYPYGLRVESLDIATGASQWIRVIEHEYGMGSQPTADGGQLFLLGSSGNTQLHALRQSDGGDLWPSAPSITSGDSSAPTLDASTVYVSVAGAQTFAFDRSTGQQRWHYAGCCTGGGGSTTALHAGRLYAHDGLVHDASSGQVVGNWRGSNTPAFSGDGGVEIGTGLRAFGPGYATTRWTFEVAYHRPFIAGPYVYGASESSQVYALRLADGAPVWCAAMTLPPGSEYPQSAYPVAAGNGLLLVPVGYGLAAFENGGTERDTCQPVNGGPGTGAATGGLPGAPPAQPAPALEIRAGRHALLLGQRTNVLGRVSGVALAKDARVSLDVDEWPLDGRFRRAVTAPVFSDGSFGFKFAPRRNSRIRARLVGGDMVSGALDLYADFPVRARKLGAGGPRPRLRVTLYAFRKAQVRNRRVYGYLARGRTGPWRRVDGRRWQRATRRSVTVRLRYPRGRLGRGDHWLVCTRERKPDAFGRPTEIERRCGERELARPTAQP